MISGSISDYRRIRNAWGLALAAAWIAYRWMQLDGQKRAALAALGSCQGLIDGAKCFWEKGNITGHFGGGVFLAVLVAPLAFVLTHYFAVWRVESQNAAVVDRAEKAQGVAALAQQRELDARMAQLEDGAARTRLSLDRGEFIHKLGAVSDFLDLLSHERDVTRAANIRLGASQALRDLTAKHSVDQLAQLIAGDHGVRLSLDAVLAKLTRSPLSASAERQVLATARDRAIQRDAPAGLLAAPNARPVSYTEYP